MDNIFDKAKQGLQAEASRKDEEARRETADQRRKEDEFANARLRLREIYAQVPELHHNIMRSGKPTSYIEGEWRTGARSLLSGSIHPKIVQKPGGRRGWPLANVGLLGQRRVQTGSNDWSGTSYGRREVTIGVQGLVLLEDGYLYEYRRLNHSRAVSIDSKYEMTSDLPPKFVMDWGTSDSTTYDPIERQTLIVSSWAAKLEETMTTLATDCLRRLRAAGPQ